MNEALAGDKLAKDDYDYVIIGTGLVQSILAWYFYSSFKMSNKYHPINEYRLKTQ